MPQAVEVLGAKNLRANLRKYSPDLEKQLKKEMVVALKPIVIKARGYIKNTSPLSGWSARSFSEGSFPFYDAGIMRRGITYTTSQTKPNRKGWAYSAAIYNKSASGAIYETAGRKNPNGQEAAPNRMGETRKRFNRSNNPRAGQSFIAGLEAASPLTQGSTKYTRPGEGRRGRYMKGRAIYRAWAEDQGRVTGAVMKAIERASMNYRARKSL
jgi:hypothetical protein